MNQPFNIYTKYRKDAACSGCALETLGTGFAIPEGTGRNGVLVLGEALGSHEAQEGLPFRPQAPAGSVLERAFRMCGYSREQFVVFNLVNCRPPNNELNGATYEDAALEHCRVHLKRVIEHYKPRVILALGAIALRSLSKMSGQKQGLDHLRGYVLEMPEFPGIHMIASYHPSGIQRGNWNVFPVFCRDIKYAVQIARDGYNPPAVEFIEHASKAEFEYIRHACLSDESLVMSVDFETEGNPNVFEDAQLNAALEELYTELPSEVKKDKKLGTDQVITQTNISVYENQSFVFAHTPENQQYVAQLLATPNPKTGFNCWMFDMLVAQFNGLPFNGVVTDVMWKIHALWPDIPGKRNKGKDEQQEGSLMNLQYAASMYNWFAPWKHLVEQMPEYYGCHDSASCLMLHYALDSDMQALRYGKDGPTVLDSYNQLVADIQPILSNMKRRGLPINKQKMLAFLKSVVLRQRELGGEIQKLIPNELRTTHPKTGYAKAPTVKCEGCGGKGKVTDSSDESRRVVCPSCKGDRRIQKTEGLVLRDFKFDAEDKRCKCFRVRKKNIADWSELQTAEYDDKGNLRAPVPDCPDCGGSGWLRLQDRVETRWCSLKPFNPNSPPQMKSYAQFNHHKVPKNSQGRYAMDKETIEKLYKRTHDELYKQAINFREFTKMRGYALGWMPGDDGRIHPTGSFFPATGQLSFTEPNAQTQPSVSKYGPLAEEFASGIEAPEGYVLIECDFKSYHAQTLGFEANCPSYIRLAKIDIHSYLATQMLKIEHCERALEWTDTELSEWLGWYKKNYKLKDGTPFKKVRDKQAKPGILGYGFGLGAGKLYRLNEDAFDNERQAKHVLDTLDATFPEVKWFRDTIPLVAYKQGGKLISRYGCVRWFWDIQRYDFHTKRYEHSGDWERCIAYLPANVAFSHKKLIMRQLEDTGMNERYQLVLDIHDALLFCCPKGLRDEAMHTVKEKMEQPSTRMILQSGEPLSFEVEVKAGKDKGHMEEIAI